MKRRGLALWLVWPATLVALGTIVESNRLFEGTRFAVHRDPRLMPSTRDAPRRYLVTGQPVLSVSTSVEALHDPERGLLVHPTARGRDWERFAYASYFDEATLRLATGVGLRVHGGKSRVGSVVKSFGLFFRRRYGAAPDARLFFGGSEGPLGRVIAHNDIRHDRTGRAWHFVNPLAYDIAGRLGAVVPRTRPMRFLLNGELQGVYVLTEHIGPDFLTARYGHSDFGLDDDANPRRLLRWARGVEAMTLDLVSQTVDLDNLTSWALTILFCGTTDVWQGHLAKDQRDPGSRFFWITWDLDHSFMDLYQRAPNPWEIDTYRTLLGVRIDPRSWILTRLFDEDPAYRIHFAAAVSEMLNHRLTPQFLRGRLHHYRVEAARHGVAETEFFEIIDRFFERRPAVLRSLTGAYLKVGEAAPVTVDVPEGRSLFIDGYRVSERYRGAYFPETPITVAVPPEHRQAFDGWMVNGKAAGAAPKLTLPVTAAASIVPRFRS